METPEHLASYQHCCERIAAGWETFQESRAQRLRERERFGHAAERATESILEDLFTGLLDWSPGDLNHQVGLADIVLTRLGIKYLVVEAKRPGALAWSERAIADALEQARGYADGQKVGAIAISDGVMLYAADVRSGGLRHRVFCPLEHRDPQTELWWLSVHGIYRDRPDAENAAPRRLGGARAAEPAVADREASWQLLHPKYRLPARCFGYVCDASDPHSWHLPYLNADGTVDARRLPKAIQAILSNYRGATVSSVPEAAIPDVLVRLAVAARSLGKMPGQVADPAQAYARLAATLEQLGRVDEVSASGA